VTASAPKRLLVLGAGLYYVRAIRAVREAGYQAVVVDRDPAAPGLAIADVASAVDLADAPAVLDVARAEHVDGVLPLNDFGVPTAAYVAEELGLLGLTPRTAALACDKGLMREQWSRDGLLNPDFRVVLTKREARAACTELGFPLVLKPADSGGGGRGVSVVRDETELEWAYAFAHKPARNGRVVVERFLEGVELTIEAISHRGDVHPLAISDKVKPPLRTRVASTLTYPAALSEEAAAEVRAVTRAAVSSLGLTDGPSHVEMVLTDDGPILLELGARGGGGHIFSTIVEAVTGVRMVRESARVLVGDEPDLRIRHERGCVYELFAPHSGVIREIVGIDEARAMPGVLDVCATRKPGDVLGDLVDSLQRSVYAVVCGADRQEAVRRAKAVSQTVRFVLDPVPGELSASHA
jgi:biotin carboxylase